LIFDSKEIYDFITCFQSKKRRSIWVDESQEKRYAYMWWNKTNTRIHHFICGNPLNGKMIDHFNGNSLDNRFENLRIVSRSENQYNRATKNKSMRCITKQKNGKYQACIRKGLGSFETLQEAQEAILNFYKDQKIIIHKDFL
jgi:hypothetical protein